MIRKLIAFLICLSTTQLASGAVRVLKLSDGEPFVRVQSLHSSKNRAFSNRFRRQTI